MRWDEPDGHGRQGVKALSPDSGVREMPILRRADVQRGSRTQPGGRLFGPAQNPVGCRLSIRSRARHTEKHPGFPVGRTTCPGDVPADPADWCCTLVASTGSPTSHQDRHRSAQTLHGLRMGRDWPVKRVTRPEPRCRQRIRFIFIYRRLPRRPRGYCREATRVREVP